ncbi:CobW family GTP-binding protein [Halomonas korlensis]|uniref:GTPase, G3E family n=1 Tax=Halomonas korlensis TaxID=463301 RepID=A0A1I7JTA3_9GAMM|nr:GTP-binding protein [Halomonas korlensis]SFU88367.1 GTPase, G3E family [Halomonas korlensis]
MQNSSNPIPVHLITGFLGSGKSTLIRQLIEQKPLDERWAVVINEFGRVGIDQSMFAERDDLIIQGLPGGCLCCQLAFVLQASLVKLVHRYRPDRLIIEPSGVGHPTGLLDVLQGEGFAGVLEVRDVIAALDPRRLEDPRSRDSATFKDQLAVADGVALTMTDLSTPAQIQASLEWAEGLWPPRKWVEQAPHGALAISWLLQGGRHDRPSSDGSSPASPHEYAKAAHGVHEEPAWREPKPGEPELDCGSSLGYASLSWRWHVQDRFDLDRLMAYLGGLPSELRVKGVFHTPDGWKLYNRADAAVTLTSSAWRHDSRLEIIGEPDAMPKAKATQAALQGCKT